MAWFSSKVNHVRQKTHFPQGDLPSLRHRVVGATASDAESGAGGTADIAKASADAQSWTLSAVGDWNSTTINGVAQSWTHTPVHEISAINGVAVTSDAAGNLTQTDAGQHFAWDDENRLLTADAVPNVDGVHGQASYLYDALGRRVAKTVFGSTTLFVYDGARVIQEIDTPTVLPSSAAGDNGSLTTLGTTPDGALIPSIPNVATPTPTNLTQPVRVNFQPANTPIPDGFLADKGVAFGTRSNGLSYGWVNGSGTPTAGAGGLIRNFHPLPQYDTLNPMGTSGMTWGIALPTGTYPVAVVTWSIGDLRYLSVVSHENSVSRL